MATITYNGNSVAVKQVETFQVTTDDAGTTYTMTVGSGNVIATVAVAGTGTGEDDTASAIQVACDASAHPYFTAIAWTVSTDTVTGTAGTAGCPFIAAASAAGATGAIGAGTVATASSGPNDWETAANWDSGTVPVSNDTIIIGVGTPNIASGMDQSGVTGTTFHHQRGAGNIGLRPSAFATTADGTGVDTTVPEYRDTYLDLPATTTYIGEAYGPGLATGATSIRINNTKAGAANTYVRSVAGTSSVTGKPVLNLQLNHASSDVWVDSAVGGLGLGVDDTSQTFTGGDINVYDKTGTSRVYIGPGVTWSIYAQQSGTSVISNANAGATTTKIRGGICTMRDSWTTGPTITVNKGATVNWAANSAAISTLQGDGAFNCSTATVMPNINAFAPELGFVFTCGELGVDFSTGTTDPDGSYTLTYS